MKHLHIIFLFLFGVIVLLQSTKAAAQTTLIFPNQPPDEGPNLQLKYFIPVKPVAVPATGKCSATLIGKAEPNIVYAFNPDPNQPVIAGQSIKVWYNDEWPLTLGAGSISPWLGSNSYVTSPNIGDESQRDSNSFPFYPALFLTDITTDPNNTAGDPRHGGKPYKPNEVYGTWKPLGHIDRYNIAMPPKNNTALPPGADPFPSSRNIPIDSWKGHGDKLQGYSAEIIWHTGTLELISGHTYRAEVILHDGDATGDIGDVCTTIRY